MTATHPSTASGVADRMALVLEELLVATSPDGIMGRLCAPLFWVIGKLMERRMRREMEKLVAILREIARNGIPLPAPVALAEPAASNIRANATGESVRPCAAHGGFLPSDGGPSGAPGTSDGVGACEWQDRAADAEMGRRGLDAHCADSPVARERRDETRPAGRPHKCRWEKAVVGPTEPVLGRASRDPGRTTTLLVQNLREFASTFGRTMSGAGGGRARCRIVLCAS